jgi:hypothetical protein
MRKLYIYNGSKSHLFLYTFLLIPFSFRLNYQFFDFYLFITGTVDRRESKGGKENTSVIKKKGGGWHRKWEGHRREASISVAG